MARIVIEDVIGDLDGLVESAADVDAAVRVMADGAVIDER